MYSVNISRLSKTSANNRNDRPRQLLAPSRHVARNGRMRAKLSANDICNHTNTDCIQTARGGILHYIYSRKYMICSVTIPILSADRCHQPRQSCYIIIIIVVVIIIIQKRDPPSCSSVCSAENFFTDIYIYICVIHEE